MNDGFFLIKHRLDNRRYLYSPTLPHKKASRAALQRMVRVFFGGSVSKAILAMFDASSDSLSKADLERIAKRLDEEHEP